MISRNNTDKEAVKKFITGFYTKENALNLFDPDNSDQTIHHLKSEINEVWEDSAQFAFTDAQLKSVYKNEAHDLLKKIQRKEKQFSITSFVKYAAISLIILSAALGVYYLADQLILKNIRYTEIRVKNGENNHIVLPDGTKVVLNAGSYLKYPNKFAGKTRLVEIDGEAFFKVTHDEDKPFIIKAEGANIKVLGTSFNVKAYNEDNQLTVSVKSGKVQVNMAEAMLRLKPDEQVILNKQSGEFTKQIEKNSRVTAWMNGSLYFNRTPIKSVVSELKRFYNCEIEFEPGKDYDDYIYGEHDNKSLESVLKSIQYATDIKFRNENGKIILYK